METSDLPSSDSGMSISSSVNTLRGKVVMRPTGPVPPSVRFISM